MAATPQHISDLSKKIAKICLNLRPYQSLEYDPEDGMLVIITEWLVPGTAADQIWEIFARRKDDEKITVRRYDENYKVTLVKRLAV